MVANVYGKIDWVLHYTTFDFLIPEQLMFIIDTSTMTYDDAYLITLE